MYNPENRHFILRQLSGKLWNIYFDKKLGICLSSMTKRNTWTNPDSLQSDAHPSFYSDMDSEDRIHVLFQDSKGELLYAVVSNGSTAIESVLKSKTPSPYNKYPYLVPQKSQTHFFYIIHHDESTLLVHQTFSNGKSSTPKVIDYVVKNSLPYSIVYDRSDSLYAFYQLSDGKHYQLGYKKFLTSQKYWGEFTPLTRYEGDCEFPVTLADSANIVHICYQRRALGQYELVYQQKIPDKNLWTGEFVIHSSAYPFDQASIVSMSGSMFVYWVRDDVIYFSTSKDRGNTWSKPARYNFNAGRQLLCMSYKTNSQSEYDKMACRDIPGSYINGLKLAFYQVPPEENNVTAGDLKNMIVDSLRLLNASVDELKDSEKSTREDITKLDLSYRNFEREIVKNSLRLNLIDNELKQLKQTVERLEALYKANNSYTCQDNTSGESEDIDT